MKRLTTRDESGYYHLRRGPKGGEINKITVVQHLGRLEDVALRPVSRERVEKVLRGEWMFKPFYKGTSRGVIECQECKGAFEGSVEFNFCPNCGAPMTDEAVDMVMEKLKKVIE